jgi:hypothetical protein
VGDTDVLDDPAPCSLDASNRDGREDGGGGKSGMTGDAGVVGLDDGDGDDADAGDVTPLRPAKIAGTGVVIATLNGGGTGKYPSSKSVPRVPAPLGGGVGGGLSAYDSLSPTTPPVRREDHEINVSGGPSNALVASFDGSPGGE